MGKPIWIYDDGGRSAAGFKGNTSDCVCRSIAIACRKSYAEVYTDLATSGKYERRSSKRRGKSHPRTGIYKPTICQYLASHGWTWIPTMQIGSGCKVHLKADELPLGRLIVSCSRHITAVIDGVIHDTHDPSRDGTRCVYGYWTDPRS